MEQGIKIKIGAKYKLRNGLTTGEIKKSTGGGNYIYEALVNEPGYDTPSVLYWLDNGSYLTRGDEHPKDIISEL